MTAAYTTAAHQFLHSGNFLDKALELGFGEVHCKIDEASGLRAIVAIHSTKRGPALGGCRFIEYADNMSAVHDALRLARGMSYKAASVNLPLGGGKAVLIKPAGAFDRKAYFQAFGQFVDSLNGRYITALDSGTELADMAVVAEHTRYVASRPDRHGDPSPSTAKGVFRGIEAAANFRFNKRSLEGLHVALQGLGHVGFLLAKYLHEAGAKLTVSDINPQVTMAAQTEFGARIVDIKDIHRVECDIYAPCALGATLNDESIPELQCAIVAGAANNQLAKAEHGEWLMQKGILYTPDYVINSGGLIYAGSKYLSWQESAIEDHIDQIYTSLSEIFVRANAAGKPTSLIADELAQERLR